MKNICVIYDSITGSTGEIGEIIKNELIKLKYSVTKCMLNDAENLSQFDIVIIGSPMRFGGFTSRVKRFVKKHRSELLQVHVLCYFSLLYIIKIVEKPESEIPKFVDPSLKMQALHRNSTTAMDRTHSLDYYYKTLQKNIYGIQPKGVAFFNGRLDLTKLSLPVWIFMKLVTSLTTKERVGEFINPDAVRQWARNIGTLMK
jgi:menaquinone-dependent protoporphyrinogen IX oxidase